MGVSQGSKLVLQKFALNLKYEQDLAKLRREKDTKTEKQNPKHSGTKVIDLRTKGLV
jgi:predicted subunit of tRNA(5-methylaminomethyl-2-thiouridylate) methyltransferase